MNEVDMSKNLPKMPLVDAIRAARVGDAAPMQIPGHKWRYRDANDPSAVGFEFLHDLLRDDIPLQGGADDNAFTGGFLVAAEALYASAIGAAHTRFLVGGSSQGNIAAFLTVSRDGSRIAVDRTSHRSAIAGLVLSGAMPVWINPTIHPEFGIPVGMPANALDSAGDVTAAFVTAPSYVGTISEISPLAAAAHKAGFPLVVDQAWGAHLDFGVPGYLNALRQGADVVVTSIHKALLGYTQTATISCNSTLIDASRLDRSVDTTATTSPSATLLASIDATRATLELDGGAAIDRALTMSAAARDRLRQVPGVVVIDESTAGCAVDPLKITLWLTQTGVSGVELAAALWELGHGVENADNDTIAMTVSIADQPQTITAIIEKTVALIEKLRRQPRAAMPSAVWSVRPIVEMTPRAAVFADRHRIPLTKAVGQISAEQFCPYPPGVPLLGPGELVTQELIEAIQIAGTTGRVAYCSDPTLKTIEVVSQ